MTGFKITSADLRLLTTRVNMVIERRNLIPALGMALVKWGGGIVSVCGTDLDNEITVTAEAKTEGWGSIMMRPQHLGWLARIGAAEVSLDLIKSESNSALHAVQLTADDITAKMNLVCDVADFPMMTLDNTMLPPLDFTQGDLHRLLTLGRSAISTEETRYYLNGIFLHGINGKARAVTTDGHRLAMIDSKAPWWKAKHNSKWRREMASNDKEEPKVFADHGIIVPRKTVGVLASLISPNANEPVHLSVSELKMSVAGPGFALKSKMIDGSYPSYERVIPRGAPEANMTLAPASIRRIAASPFSSEHTKALKFDLAAGVASMVLPDLGGEISVPISANGDFSIGFNAAYVVDTARALGGTIRLEMTRSGDPARVYGEDPDAMFLLMPMRV